MRVHEFLGLISYIGGNGPKIAHFWRMQAVGSTVSEPLDDIKAVEWLTLSAAIERLSLPHEQSFLRNVGKKAVKRTQKRPRRKSASETPVRTGDRVRMADDLQAAALAFADLGWTRRCSPTASTSSPQPRWEMLARLTKHWQTAVGRTRRAG